MQWINDPGRFTTLPDGLRPLERYGDTGTFIPCSGWNVTSPLMRKALYNVIKICVRLRLLQDVNDYYDSVLVALGMKS